MADATDAAGTGVGVAEALAPAPGDPVRDGDTTAFGCERGALEEAELPEPSEPAEGGSSAREDQGGELVGGGDTGAVEQPQAGAIADGEEPDVEAATGALVRSSRGRRRSWKQSRRSTGRTEHDTPARD